MARSNTGETPAAQSTTPLVGELKFEAALSELEQIILNMEGGRLPLEESLEAYRHGTELLKHCQQQLGDAERKIQILENDMLHDFEPNNGDLR